MAVMVDKPTHSPLGGVNSYLAEHREISNLVREAQRFSLNVPVIGKVGVPKPRDLAAFGVLGGLAAFGIIEWPAAVSLAVGVIVAERSVNSLRHRNHVAPRNGVRTAQSTGVVDGTVTAGSTNLAKRSSRGPSAHRWSGRRS